MRKISLTGRLGIVLFLGLATPVAAQVNTEETIVESRTASSPRSLCDVDPILTPPRCPIYFRADALVLMRDVHGATDAATLGDPQNVVLSTRDLSSPFQVGPKFLIGRTFGESSYQVEFAYFSLNDWDDSVAVRDTSSNALGYEGNLFSPFTGFGNPPNRFVDYCNFVYIREFSYLDSMEVNLRRLLPMPPDRLTTSFLVGFRYLGVREQFDYYSESEVPPVQDLPPNGVAHSVNTRTVNELYGLQIGGLFEFYCEHQWWVNFEMKAAICQNAARQQTTLAGNLFPPQPETVWYRSENSTAFIGELALTLVCRPANWLAARIGYQVMWVDGLALASRNFAPDINILTLGPAQLDHRGGVVYHGPHAGLEVAW